MIFTLDTEYMRRADLRLAVEDLRHGFLAGYISGPTTIELACDAVATGDTGHFMMELCCLSREDDTGLRQLLGKNSDIWGEELSERSRRLWAFLQLKAAYDMREQLQDPFGVVEQIYADFDYPPTIAAFTRYMPSPSGAAGGLEALYERWTRYLDEEARSLHSVTPD